MRSAYARIPAGEITSLRVRVGYVDTDQARVMHHSTYLRYLEMGRVEHLRERGVDYKSMELDAGLATPVVEATVRYKLPARFDDVLEIKTWIGAASRAKLRFDSVILRDAVLITEAEITICCISIAKQRICSMPAALIALASKA